LASPVVDTTLIALKERVLLIGFHKKVQSNFRTEREPSMSM